MNGLDRPDGTPDGTFVTMIQNDDLKNLRQWLALFNGPGYQGLQARDRAVAEMRAVGADRLFPLLGTMLHDSDVNLRCTACEAILRVDAKRGLELILPGLLDSDSIMRWDTCGLLHDFGDERAVEPLIMVLKNDPDAQVRGIAAYALGGIGSPAVIPALLAAQKSDFSPYRSSGLLGTSTPR